MKICNVCEELKEESLFPVRTRYGKVEIVPRCKSCVSKYRKSWRDKNIEQIKIKDKRYKTNNKDKEREYRGKNRERYARYNAKYRETHKNELKELARNWYIKNKGKLIEAKKRWRAENISKARKADRVYYQKNKEKMDGRIREYQKKQRDNLGDYYIKQVLVAGTRLQAKDLPKELIEAKREVIRIRRHLKVMT